MIGESRRGGTVTLKAPSSTSCRAPHSRRPDRAVRRWQSIKQGGQSLALVFGLMAYVMRS
jgi:hypothetical protein